MTTDPGILADGSVDVEWWVALYREQGLSVIPLTPGTKRPEEEWRGYVSAGKHSTDDERRMWLRSGRGVAAVCGAPSGGVWALDFERREDFEQLMGPSTLNSTLVVETPHGGIHVYFRSKGRTAQAENTGSGPTPPPRHTGGGRDRCATTHSRGPQEVRGLRARRSGRGPRPRGHTLQGDKHHHRHRHTQGGSARAHTGGRIHQGGVDTGGGQGERPHKAGCRHRDGWGRGRRRAG
ncbi:hypothetical protein B9Q04_19720 [Candidatus Marsarchaeota G2 archaeon BE_D]|uniref:DNA primase/polymerase bifunctional N-terminal domain-containing protein n=1 Tax=Candidatus Marsarchaeota G2 archaeon BE_D TaxID=1978158 RepID=A0A2R6BZC1_9ARCH|nr:MAG: hypothetical protein B9Q04_19720 [Candidatus Marsarchaeota G2 archaeon BE_D]